MDEVGTLILRRMDISSDRAAGIDAASPPS
jgi:hypothetical protein